MTAPIKNNLYYDQYGVPTDSPSSVPPDGSGDYADFDSGGEDDFYLAGDSEGDEAPEGATGDEFGVSEEFSEEGVADSSSLRNELTEYKSTLRGIDNLTDGQKDEFERRIDEWLGALELGESDSEEIAGEFAALKEEIAELSRFSPAAQSLADMLGSSPEEVEAKAEEEGINLQNPPNPPTEAFMEFLMELSPELKAKFEGVEEAVNERQRAIENNLQTAESINDSNNNSTTDTDNSDTSAWQMLFDLKFYQDDKSQTVRSAMNEVVSDLIPIFQALYPDEEVTAPEVEGVSGWARTQQEYLKAGQISIGDVTIDLFNNIDGKMRVSSTPDESPDFEIPGIDADGEGDGHWTPPDLQTYSDSQPDVRRYGDGG